MTNIADFYYVFPKFINYYRNITHAEEFSNLLPKLCDHPLNFFLKYGKSASFLGWLYDKDVLPHSYIYKFAIYTLTSFQQM